MQYYYYIYFLTILLLQIFEQRLFKIVMRDKSTFLPIELLLQLKSNLLAQGFHLITLHYHRISEAPGVSLLIPVNGGKLAVITCPNSAIGILSIIQKFIFQCPGEKNPAKEYNPSASISNYYQVHQKN